MPKKILITGGSGLIGQQLTTLLLEKGYKVAHLGRKIKTPSQDARLKHYVWDIKKGKVDPEALAGTNAIIHLAGAGVMDHRWTASYKKEIIESRVNSTRLLHKNIHHAFDLETFITASAIGFYGADTRGHWVDEATAPGNDFLASVVQAWEQSADLFSKSRCRTVKIRIGIVLSKDGGALPQLIGPIKVGLGAPIGTGKQYLSWIHINDLARIFLHVLEKEEMNGVYNGVAPAPVSNAEFTNVAATLLAKPIWMPAVPGFVIEAIFGKEKAQVLLGGSKVRSNKIEQEGFKFMFIELKDALKAVIKS